MRVLIVNADDLGLSDAVNRGVARAHERGVVTSASLMVDRPASRAAAAYARAHPRLGIGLHLEPDDPWRQLTRFRELVGGDPTHVDGHHHCHLDEPVRAAAVAIAAELGVPLRSLDPRVRFVGDFFGAGRIEVEPLLGLLETIEPGVTELMCHPGLEPAPTSSYARERAVEVETLCDARVREALDRLGIVLRSFRDAFDQ